MSVVTRFAPSPTGFLHIGGARAGFFNWQFGRLSTRFESLACSSTRGRRAPPGDRVVAYEHQARLLNEAVRCAQETGRENRRTRGLVQFLVAERPLTPDDAAKKHLDPQMKEWLQRLKDRLSATPDWENTALAAALKAFATDEGVGMGQIGPGLRAALTGGAPAPDLGQTLEALGREESLARIADQI